MARIHSTFAMALVFLIGACNTAPPQSPQEKGKGPNPNVNSSSSPLCAVFQAFSIRMLYPQATIPSYTVDVALWNGSGVSIDGGIVKLNDVPVTIEPATAGTSYRLTSQDLNQLPLKFNGSYHTFKVLGNGAFAPMIDSIQSPTGEVNATAPLPGANLSKSTGFTVRWTPGNAGSALILLTDTAAGPNHKAVARKIADNGSYTFAPSELSSLVPGPLKVDVGHGNYLESTTTDGRRYQMAIHSSDIINTILVP